MFSTLGLFAPSIAFASSTHCNEYLPGCAREGYDAGSTKDVDNEQAEERTERRGEEYENEAQEERHETVKQEAAEQQYSRGDAGSGSGSGSGSHEPGASR